MRRELEIDFADVVVRMDAVRRVRAKRMVTGRKDGRVAERVDKGHGRNDVEVAVRVR